MAGVEACQNFQKERYATKNDTDIIALRQPESVVDPLTEIARDGARRMLAAALRAEADAFAAQHSEEILPDGRQRVVRYGCGPERSIQTGVGALDVRRPKARPRVRSPLPARSITGSASGSSRPGFASTRRMSREIRSTWARASGRRPKRLPRDHSTGSERALPN